MKFGNRRTKLYIDRKVQGAILRRLILHWGYFFAAALLTISVMHFFYTAPDRPQDSFVDYVRMALNQHMIMFVVLLTLIPIFLRDTLKLTHRFVGPIVRIRHALKELADGGMIEPIKFRKGDYWEELAEMMNTVAKRINDLESAKNAEPEASDEDREAVPV